MSVLVDPRIGSGDMLAALKALGTPAESTPMDFADCAFMGKGPGGAPVAVGVELKKLDDILACIVTGRFSGHQLPGLVQNYDEVYLVIEGIYRPNPKDGVLETRVGKDWQAVQRGNGAWMARDLSNYLSTIEVRGGVRVRRTSNRQETVREVSALYNWWVCDFEDHTAHRAINRSRDAALFTKPSLKFQVASMLPGLGMVRAGEAAGKFASVHEMVNADAKAWQMPGIGKPTAEAIVAAIRSTE